MNIPLNAVTYGEDEISEAIAVLKSGHVTMGPKCSEFEKEFAKYLGVEHAIFVNSGSSANLLAAFTLTNFAVPEKKGKRRLQPGDEVIVPTLTWSTTIWPIVQAGLIPVLVDCDPNSLQMKFEDVEKAIGPKTRAIFVVHVLGNAVAMAPILTLAEKHGLWVVEDTCESLGTNHAGAKTGTFGDFGTYSFFFSHHMTTIEGGMVVTNDEDSAELLRCLRAHGWTRHLKNRQEIEALYPDIDSRFLFVNLGFNLRPTEINAAFGLHQLKKLDGFNARRREIGQHWGDQFSELTAQKLLVPMQTTQDTELNWFGYSVLLPDRSTRDQFKAHLENKGIETRPVICGNLIRQPAFRSIEHRVVGSLDGANRVMDCGLFWGIHPVMTQEQVDYVSSTVKQFFELSKNPSVRIEPANREFIERTL